VIDKAKIACEKSGQAVPDHFVDVSKMVEIGSQTQRSVDDLALTRYACYLITQNGDPRKDAIASAITYLAVQTAFNNPVNLRQCSAAFEGHCQPIWHGKQTLQCPAQPYVFLKN
jgi:DNA-directed RNA polymerase subunit N (RpoN/RPB10)